MKENEPPKDLSMEAEKIIEELKVNSHKMLYNQDIWMEILASIPSLQDMNSQDFLGGLTFDTEKRDEKLIFSPGDKERSIFWQKLVEKDMELILIETLLTLKKSIKPKLDIRNHFYPFDLRSKTIADVTFSGTWKRTKEIIITPHPLLTTIDSVRNKTPKINGGLTKEEAFGGIHLPYKVT